MGGQTVTAWPPPPAPKKRKKKKKIKDDPMETDTPVPMPPLEPPTPPRKKPVMPKLERPEAVPLKIEKPALSRQRGPKVDLPGQKRIKKEPDTGKIMMAHMNSSVVVPEKTTKLDPPPC